MSSTRKKVERLFAELTKENCANDASLSLFFNHIEKLPDDTSSNYDKFVSYISGDDSTADTIYKQIMSKSQKIDGKFNIKLEVIAEIFSDTLNTVFSNQNIEEDYDICDNIDIHQDDIFPLNEIKTEENKIISDEKFSAFISNQQNAVAKRDKLVEMYKISQNLISKIMAMATHDLTENLHEVYLIQTQDNDTLCQPETTHLTLCYNFSADESKYKKKYQATKSTNVTCENITEVVNKSILEYTATGKTTLVVTMDKMFARGKDGISNNETDLFLYTTYGMSLDYNFNMYPLSYGSYMYMRHVLHIIDQKTNTYLAPERFRAFSVLGHTMVQNMPDKQENVDIFNKTYRYTNIIAQKITDSFLHIFCILRFFGVKTIVFDDLGCETYLLPVHHTFELLKPILYVHNCFFERVTFNITNAKICNIARSILIG